MSESQRKHSGPTPEWAIAVNYEEGDHLPVVEDVSEQWTADGLALVDGDGNAQIAAENPWSNRQ